MTLLVVALPVPELSGGEAQPGTLLRALNDLQPEIVSFFVGFALLGFYWLAHHRFFALLRGVSRGLILVNLVYLAAVAFLPFPTALIGDYEANPVAFVLFALSVATISGLEVVLFVLAADQDLTSATLPTGVRRSGVVRAGAPVLVFLLSIPLAFWSPSAALLSWLLVVPLGALLRRLLPSMSV